MCIKSIESCQKLLFYRFKVYICISKIHKIDKRRQILTLIESDIVSSKLIFTLNNVGVDANHYLNDISHVIFVQIGIRKENRTEELYKKYFDLIKQVQYLDIQVKGEKSRLALKIYGFFIANI
jgi:hypothetical protein